MNIDIKFARLCKKALFSKGIPLSDVLCSTGNHKIPKTTAIFNMGSAKDCPSAELGLCKAVVDGKSFCYAKKAEYLYPAVLPYRRRQEEFWKAISAELFAVQFLLLIAYKMLYLNNTKQS